MVAWSPPAAVASRWAASSPPGKHRPMSDSLKPEPQAVAFLGIGEAAGAFLEGWDRPGLRRVSAFDIKSRGPGTRGWVEERCKHLAVANCPSPAEALRGAGLVLSLVTADQALDAAAEAAPHLPLPAEDVAAYRSALLQRYANSRIRHQLAQIVADGSTKVVVRTVPVIRAERAAGRVPLGCATVVAAWIRHLRGAGAPLNDGGAEPYLAVVGDGNAQPRGAHHPYRAGQRLAVRCVVRAGCARSGCRGGATRRRAC